MALKRNARKRPTHGRVGVMAVLISLSLFSLIAASVPAADFQVGVSAQVGPVPTVAVPGDNSRTFPETGKVVSGLFLDYWNNNGGLAQQGYPISDVISEVSDLDGNTYAVQYFERAVFEYHAENRHPYNVLLSQLGTFQYKQKYPGGAPKQTPNIGQGSVLFEQTGHRLGGVFHNYWVEHGGLAQQGYPISDPFWEESILNGEMYIVQYFERAVFEYHPEFAGTSNEVLLSQLGTFRYNQKYSENQVDTMISKKGKGWTFSHDPEAPFWLDSINDQELDKLDGMLPNPIHALFFKDAEQAIQYGKEHGMDPAFFKPLYAKRMADNAPVAFVMAWENPDAPPGIDLYYPLPLDEASQLDKLNPIEAKGTILANSIRRTTVSSEQYRALLPKVMPIYQPNISLVTSQNKLQSLSLP